MISVFPEGMLEIPALCCGPR